MKPGFQSQSYTIRNFGEPQAMGTLPKSPQHKNQIYQDSHTSQSSLFYNPNEQPDKKITTSIKALGDKIQGVEAIMRRNSGRFDKITMNTKTQSNKQLNTYTSGSPSTKASDFQSMRREQSEPDLRTSCPNVFRKFQQTSLRNTMHSNNYTKFGNMMAEIKKHDKEEHKQMKKQAMGISQPMTPTPRNQHPKFDSSGFIPTSSFKKPHHNLFKSRTEIKSTPVVAVKEKKNTINGFFISKQLGKGKFGQVYLGRHEETGFIVALKKIVKSKLAQYKMIQQFKREIKLHSCLDHPNIVKFYGFFQHEDTIYLILEYISGGTLFDYLTEKDMLQSKQAVEYLRDTIEGVTYMHEKSIAHRDIKPQNIVLTAEKVAKICDFGWSALVESSRTTYCGTFDYAPPEILQRKNYDTAVDIWCLGVLTYEILTGRVPFEGQKRKQIMDKILSVDKNKIYYPVQIPEDAKSFIQLLVQKDPTQRPKSKDLLKLPFFQNNLKGKKL